MQFYLVETKLCRPSHRKQELAMYSEVYVSKTLRWVKDEALQQ